MNSDVNLIDLPKDDREVTTLLEEISDIEEDIEVGRSESTGQQSSLRETENEIAVLEYRLDEAVKLSQKTDSDSESNRDEYRIDLLEKAISYLEESRIVTNQSVIDGFKEIILRVLNSLGLESFTDIEIDSKLRISYIQGGEKLTYSDISEGEQLRVKIALYLALVQLNSEHGVGNHPRLLIIDSPGKEEADDKYFDGLIGALGTIEDEFSDKIQILIGSADRRLSNIVSEEKQEVKAVGKEFF